MKRFLTNWGAGIGSGMVFPDGGGERSNKCGNINITGGTITATGGYDAAGIGGGNAQNGGSYDGHVKCGTITITSGVTRVTATKGGISINSIGRGRNTSGTQKCGKITIGGTVYWGLKEGSSTAYEYKNGGDTYLTTSPLTYQP